MISAEKDIKKINRFNVLKTVLLYTTISVVYIYTSDYFLEKFITNKTLLTDFQTYKGTGFVVVTSILLYILIKRNTCITTSYFQQIIEIKKTSNNQLKTSHEEYMSLFNHGPFPIYLFDIDTFKFLLVNDAACNTYGYTKEEFLSMTIRDIRPLEDIPLMEKLIHDNFPEEEHVFVYILRHKKKNGEIIHVKLKSHFVYFEGKKVRIVTSVDLTEEINVQNKLIETNSKLQSASEIANMGYWTNNLQKHEIEWSKELYKIFELNPETFELTFGNIKKQYHPDDVFEFDFNSNFSFVNATIVETERRIITGSGNIKWVLERINLIKDSDEKLIKLDGIVIDITKRKLHEQEIIESNERFKIIAKATIEAIVDWDLKNDIVIWGEGFHTVFGYDLSVYDNYLWSNNIHPEDREKVLEDLNKILEDPTKEYFTAEFRFLKANRDIAYVRHKGILIRDANGKPIRILAALIDLTETLDKLRKIESQKEILQDIAWTQSHLVRAPLANLQGFIKLLKEDIISGTIDVQLLDYIIESTEKLDEIIKEIVKKTRDINNL